MLAIQNHSQKLIGEIEMAQQECLAAVKVNKSTTFNFRTSKAELDALNNAFDSFEIDGKKCEEILVKSTTLKQRLEPMMEEYRQGLMRNKTFKLTTLEINVDQIFGSFKITEVQILVNIFNIFNEFENH